MGFLSLLPGNYPERTSTKVMAALFKILSYSFFTHHFIQCCIIWATEGVIK